ncbi:formin-like protein 4 [Neltuma alba]|uniref:formin-like protein 4 n=1 Tax=Neltuma alba TaxID=207710 RepID=UPI0010A59B64|nr:formin-like protein 4 [Prosopis alba]XP_028788045.1 formin-like protein 4 [Prosopis alba]
MALGLMIPHSWLLFLSFLFVFHSSLIPLCHSQSSSPQNIETFFPTSPSAAPPEPPGEPQASPTGATGASSSTGKIAKAVAATAAATFVVSGLIFFIVYRCLRTRRKQEAVVPQNQINGFERIGGNVRGLIVDENGLDVVYWRKLQGRSSKGDFQKEVFRSSQNKERQEKEENDVEGKKPEMVQEFPLLRGKSSTSHIPEDDDSNRIITARTSLPPKSAIPKRNSSAPPTSSPPTLQPVQARKNSPPAPSRPRPPPTVKSSSKPPPASHEMPTNNGESGNSSGEGMSESGNGQVKLKPSQWDRMSSKGDHSKGRDKADAGSFSVDQDLMEALFGYVAINRRSPKGRTDSASKSRGVSSQGQVRL